MNNIVINSESSSTLNDQKVTPDTCLWFPNEIDVLVHINRLLIIIIMLSSNKPYMTKEVFSKFLYEKQRDSRLNEELYPPLRPDQVKALIDKYEPASSNSNRGESTITIRVHNTTESGTFIDTMHCISKFLC